MKGVVLAGGLGTRLRPLTRITNKHLLPVWDRPMVHYPIAMLVEAGIREILLVTGGNAAGDFLRLLGNGEDFGLSRLHYAYQRKEGGIADALGLAKEFVGEDKVVVALGDNILLSGIRDSVERFAAQRRGARIILAAVDDPEAYGIAELFEGRIIRIHEKPEVPPSKMAVIGVYMYPPDVFDIIGGLSPSARGELEITDVNNAYIARGDMESDTLPWSGGWLDAGGSHEALLMANISVAMARGVLL